MANEKSCPICGKPVGASGLDGLCPECMLKAGFPTGTEPGTGGAGGSSFVAPSVEEVRKLFPHLEVIEMIGRGGMGAVYKARQTKLDRLVALKILPPGIGDDRAFADRFVREAKALAKLNHSNIVTLYEFDQADGLFYFMMEFVDGVNLRQLLQAGRLAPREALAIVPQICDALQYAHDHGIVHRDIKPENILLDRKGQVKVADFGVARLMGIEGEVPGAESGQAGSASVSLTEAGKVMGTPQYMAPEQKNNPTEVDHRADIYSLGVVFYQMLTGELPGKRIEAPSKKVLLDVRLDEVVLRALERKPELRYQQASEMKTQVEAMAQTQPTGSNRSLPSRGQTKAAEEAQGEKSRIGPELLTAPAIIMMSAILAYAAGILGGTLVSMQRVGHSSLWIMVMFVLGALGSPLLALVVRHYGKPDTQRTFLRTGGILAFIVALPLVGFSAFFLYELIQERGRWNPAPDEAVIVPLIWLGTVLLPICGLRLLRVANQRFADAKSVGSRTEEAYSEKPDLRHQEASVLKTDVETIAGGKPSAPPTSRSPFAYFWEDVFPGCTSASKFKNQYIRFWEKLFGDVTSSGAIMGFHVSLTGFIGFFALLAIIPGMRWCLPGLGFFPMLGLIGVAYVFEAAARSGVDLSQTCKLPDPNSQRAHWRRRIFWLIVAGIIPPIFLFAMSLIVLGMRGGEKALEAATALQMALIFAKAIGIALGASVIGWVWCRVSRKKSVDGVGVWPRHAERLIAFVIFWPVLAVAASVVIWEFALTARVQHAVDWGAESSSLVGNGFSDIWIWAIIIWLISGMPGIGIFRKALVKCIGKTESGPEVKAPPMIQRPDRFWRRFVIFVACLPLVLIAIVVVYLALSQVKTAREQKIALLQAQNAATLALPEVVIADRAAVVKQRQFNGEGLLFLFGDATNRWEGKHLDSLFAVTLQSHLFGHGADWVIRSAHGNIGYNLETPTGHTVTGEIVFHRGTPRPESDGAYVIAEFQPDSGKAIPIAVKLVRDQPAPRAEKNQTNSDSSPITSPEIQATNSSRTFKLQHKRADLMAKHLYPVLKSATNAKAEPSTDNSHLTVTAPTNEPIRAARVPIAASRCLRLQPAKRWLSTVGPNSRATLRA